MTTDNMRVLGIIAEYNPWHFGHRYQLEECMRLSGADYSVAVMNGHFTQRGEPALMDKWTRAEAAIRGGIDLVIEMPFWYGCNSAEFFAEGGVDILEKTGIVTHIGFGSENGDVSLLEKAAEILADEPEELSEAVKEKMSQGKSYPKSRMEAVELIAGKQVAGVLYDPNNILAVEYLKRMKRNGSRMIPVTVRRKGSAYNDERPAEVSSAGGIRKMVLGDGTEKAGNYVPEHVFRLMKEYRWKMTGPEDDVLFRLLAYSILSGSVDASCLFSAGEGLENLLAKYVRESTDAKELYMRMKSRRYTYSRISRLGIHHLVNFRKDCERPDYIRILGFGPGGRKLLKEMRRKAENTEIITNVSRRHEKNMYLDIRATDVYNLISGRNLYENSDFVKKPVIVQ